MEVKTAKPGDGLESELTRLPAEWFPVVVDSVKWYIS